MAQSFSPAVSLPGREYRTARITHRRQTTLIFGAAFYLHPIAANMCVASSRRIPSHLRIWCRLKNAFRQPRYLHFLTAAR